jgi:protein SCO1/2
MRGFFIVSVALLVLASCNQPKPLPVYGERTVQGTDTLYHTIRPFSFVNQDSVVVTNATFRDKIYVADFFFTSCRTICPVMKTQMLRVYEATAEMPDVLILSHTIDPEHDDVEKLHDFADRLGASSDRWHFVTGLKDSIYHIAQTSYFATAMEDKTEPDGTEEQDVNRLIGDIKRLRIESSH